MPLIAELKRRNVFKVGAAYLALAWVVVQITGTVVPAFDMPAWTLKFVIWLGAIGFPCVLLFSWAYELTPEGLKRENEVDRSQSITQVTSKRLDYIIIGLLVVAIGLFLLQYLRPPVALNATKSPETANATDLPAESAPLATSPEQIAAAPDEKSIAVLPFVNMSSDKEQEYFSDGISEELLNLLARIPELKVIARTSSFAFKGKEANIAEIARTLNVAHVLEGSVRKAGNQVRITAQLVRTNDSTHLWSDSWDRPLDNIFAVQDEIAGAVVEQLKLKLLGEPTTTRKENPEAYALALQARHFASYETVAGAEKALALYGQALALDPGYPRALVGMHKVYISQGNLGQLKPDEAQRKAREAVDQALARDPLFAPAHAALARFARGNDGDFAAAAQHFRRALELAAGDPDIAGDAALLLFSLGKHDRALALAADATAHDPVNPIRHYTLGFLRYIAGDWDGAIAAMRTVSALTPGSSAVQLHIALALLEKDEAATALAEIATESDEEFRVKGSAMALHSLGRLAEFDKALQELTTRWGAQWPSEVAQVHAWSGNADQAFAWLDKAVAQKEEGLTDQFMYPVYAPIHADPRWQAFRERTGTSEAQLAAIEFDVRLPETR